MKIKLKHRNLTDEECYENVKKLYEQYPDIVMKPEKWKKKRERQLKKEGKVWSK